MQKSGGIIALVGGIFGTFAAVATLMAGGFVAGLEGASATLGGTVVDNSASSQITTFGILGLISAFLTIILGAIAMNAKSKKPGIFLIVCAVIGAITGGTMVAVCMVLTLAGGIVAIIGTKNEAAQIE
tara:strand:- start:292 stop:675 length:384 start_codon:yes stop_codon:yes gene_type:complete